MSSNLLHRSHACCSLREKRILIMQGDLEAAIDKAMTAGEPPVPDAPKAEVEDRVPVKSPAAKEPERKTLTTATR